MSIFNLYAKYYNIFYKDKNYLEEAKYIDNIIKQYCPSAKKLLELGCGTGNHAFHLNNMNYEVTGIDLSENMIQIANDANKNIALPHPKFLVQDIRNFDLNMEFDSIISLFHVMSYQTSNEDLNNVFKMANKHLKKGGVFCFDCWYGPGVITDKPEIREKTYDNNEIIIKRKAIPTMLINENRVNVKYEIEITDKQSNEKAKIEEEHNMRYLFKPEIELIAKNNGLKLMGCFEWMQKTEPNENTWYAFLVIKKE
ncbi:MAG: hypothetical protein A2X12_07320 [Bacteroidetes bacterium GWE2_29_8]|nr:MAG: hypothetical protein A2X12_07320 [Bacteroidetes bacterium GWE2_29_8]OFY24584.1 MAG: hypothetical protein A2X02_03200 [Bacteroidetes bacterium GWF2_29_10]